MHPITERSALEQHLIETVIHGWVEPTAERRKLSSGTPSSQASSHIDTEYTETLYMRAGWFVSMLNGVMPAIRISSLSVKQPGHGTFTALEKVLTEYCDRHGYVLVVENVLCYTDEKTGKRFDDWFARHPDYIRDELHSETGAVSTYYRMAPNQQYAKGGQSGRCSRREWGV